ncbi:MAG: alpha-E domain-containing protein [Sphingobium sp.]|nr:alpha-E domain-containing protein [Sphingobium sp.]
MTTLGKTAGGLFWMFRYLERSENLARLIEAGFRISLTRGGAAGEEWRSIISTAGVAQAYEASGGTYSGPEVVNYLLRDKSHGGSVLCMIEKARDNGRVVRTAITREVWEATNECYITARSILARPVKEADLPDILASIRRQSALVRGALHGTMLRNDIYNFARLGTFIERADNSARILDVKYYLLLPSLAHVGSLLDSSQWETVLRSLSALHSFRWLHPGDPKPVDVAQFLILDGRFPRSILFCIRKIHEQLHWLEQEYGQRLASQHISGQLLDHIGQTSIEKIFESGLHEFLQSFMAESSRLAQQIEEDYRFIG